MSHDPNASGITINWQMFGSNGQETADYSRGVLERFTRRSADTSSIKTVCNPRSIDFLHNPHMLEYFAGRYPLDESGKPSPGVATAAFEKIVINHYHCKSWEEYVERAKRGDVFWLNTNQSLHEKIV